MILARFFETMITVYVYQKCSTCRAAMKWLDENNIPHRIEPIRENPPKISELRTALARVDGDLRKLFNTSSADYRAAGLKDRLNHMPSEEALELLATHGNLVKRPFVIGPGVSLSGFKPDVWAAALL